MKSSIWISIRCSSADKASLSPPANQEVLPTFRDFDLSSSITHCQWKSKSKHKRCLEVLLWETAIIHNSSCNLIIRTSLFS